jgi:hypothetical protein
MAGSIPKIGTEYFLRSLLMATDVAVLQATTMAQIHFAIIFYAKFPHSPMVIFPNQDSKNYIMPI